MAISYSQIIDPELIEKTVADEYQYEARFVESKIAKVEGTPPDSSQLAWLKETLFDGSSNDGQGQAIGVNSQINLKSKSQAQYQMPIVQRADGAELDDLADEIVAKRGADDIRLDVTNAVSRQSAQMTDWVMSSSLEGCMLYVESVGAGTANFYDPGASSIALTHIARALATRGEKYLNITERGGIFITRSGNGAALRELGLVAATSNTMGNMKQNQIVDTGITGTILGMTFFLTDKISAAAGSDQYSIMIEQNALRTLLAPVKVDPIQRKEREFKDVIKFYIRGGAVVDGIYWNAAKTNLVTNADLQTATNYTIAKTYWDDVPMCVLRTAQDSNYPA